VPGEGRVSTPAARSAHRQAGRQGPPSGGGGARSSALDDETRAELRRMIAEEIRNAIKGER
jgi:hypothetical protein